MDRWQSLTSIILCGAYCGVAGFLLARQFDWGDATAYAVIGGLAGVLLSGFPAGRIALKVAAALELVAAVLAFRIFARGVIDSNPQHIGYYVACGVVLPGLVLAFAGIRKPETFEPNLPPGYEHVSRSSQPMAAWKKLGLVPLVSFLLLAQMFSAVLFVLIWVLPVGLTIYYLIQILRTRKPSATRVARRLAVPSQREQPVQSRSHWTVISHNGKDGDH
jgi:hypothetical protein